MSGGVFRRGPGRAKPRIVGHRGGRGEGWPTENTLEAFARACDEDADAFELDVRACATGEVVVVHDPDLARVTGGVETRAVEAVPLAELARIRLAGGELVPTLDDALELARARYVAVNVEIKYDVAAPAALARRVAEVVRRHPDVEVIVSSFDPRILAVFGAFARRTPRALLVHARGHRSTATLARRLRAPWVQAIHAERTRVGAGEREFWGGGRAAVGQAHERGLAYGVWTVNDPDDAVRVARSGVDWIITDAPGAVRRALEAADDVPDDVRGGTRGDGADAVIAVGAVVFDARGRVLLIQRGHAPAAGSWTLPGGRPEPGEALARAVEREVREETALVVGALRKIDVVRVAGDGVAYDVHEFLCVVDGANAGATERALAGDDARAVRWASDADFDDLGVTNAVRAVVRRARAIAGERTA